MATLPLPGIDTTSLAELEAAIRYWDGEVASDQEERGGFARQRAAQCRARLKALRGDPMREVGC